MTMLSLSNGVCARFDLVFQERVRNGPAVHAGGGGDRECTAIVVSKAYWNHGELLLVEHDVRTREHADKQWKKHMVWVALHKVKALDAVPEDCVAQPILGEAVRLALRVHAAMVQEIFDGVTPPAAPAPAPTALVENVVSVGAKYRSGYDDGRRDGLHDAVTVPLLPKEPPALVPKRLRPFDEGELVALRATVDAHPHLTRLSRLLATLDAVQKRLDDAELYAVSVNEVLDRAWAGDS